MPDSPSGKTPHPEGCPCVRCKPRRCVDCGSQGVHPWEDRCTHRRACEARQMLNEGVPADVAARHAQGLGS